MDIASIIGLVLGLVAWIASTLMTGGNLASLINFPSLIMVIGGTIGGTMLSYPMDVVVKLPKYLGNAFTGSTAEIATVINQFVDLADQARREGLLSLEEAVNEIDNDFIKKGIMLIVDGVDPAVVRDILETDNDITSDRHKQGIGIIDMMGTLAPAMGLIGTVTGLVGVLGNLSDMDALGPSIAVAFLTTLYGAILANMFFIPMSNKLKEKDKAEMLVRGSIVEGILSIQAGENPRIVREKLESFIPPTMRGQEDGGDGGE